MRHSETRLRSGSVYCKGIATQCRLSRCTQTPDGDESKAPSHIPQTAGTEACSEARLDRAKESRWKSNRRLVVREKPRWAKHMNMLDWIQPPASPSISTWIDLIKSPPTLDFSYLCVCACVCERVGVCVCVCVCVCGCVGRAPPDTVHVWSERFH